MSEELKPCPFCGHSNPAIYNWHDFDRETFASDGVKWYISCIGRDCWVTTYKHFRSKAAAIAAWNLRSEPAEKETK